ncbi:hypothetical protein ACFL27_00170 [candidate division CSSED10-310 bacterium]|uniref:Class I SAM-dependent methyltransferase n=1 Tax=candidate division CSSED10-310 bacterium TaxID=2855610 RepID=A0ABV6YQW5_UNCC1
MNKLLDEKIYLIDHVCDNFRIKSFADLGGGWGVNGGYTFYTLQNYKMEKAYLVDTNIPEEAKELQKLYPQLTLLESNFGSNDVLDDIGFVGAIFLFDVLLHQVAPDWNEIIRMYADITHCFLVFNQQYLGPETVRLLDLGEAEYFKNVPHTREEEPYKSVMEKMYQIHPEHNRIYRDIHNIWQWGIVKNDLIKVMKEHNFKEVYFNNHGLWGGVNNFEAQSFIFRKSF